VAVLAVLLFHCGYLPAGWAGVQVFFVLSGFLITRQLSRTCTPMRFWEARARRLLPLLYLYLTLNAALCLVQKRSIVTYAAHYVGLTDVMIAASSVATHGHVGHLWSIAVELQTYAVFPALFIWRRATTPLLIILTVAGTVAFFTLDHWATMAGSIGFFAAGGLLAKAGWTPPALQLPAWSTLIGRAGYSIYLWQLMAISIAARLGVGWLGAPVSIAVGLISYWLFEVTSIRTRSSVAESPRKAAPVDPVERLLPRVELHQREAA
jgi:peptidoglycan/LPS O-acetylase OafA/YrhL